MVIQRLSGFCCCLLFFPKWPFWRNAGDVFCYFSKWIVKLKQNKTDDLKVIHMFQVVLCHVHIGECISALTLSVSFTWNSKYLIIVCSLSASGIYADFTVAGNHIMWFKILKNILTVQVLPYLDYILWVLKCILCSWMENLINIRFITNDGAV